MEKLSIKSFVIEYRQRIQSGNCFICFNHALDTRQTKISLKSTEIVIQVNDEIKKIETKDFFDINIESFHQLLVKDKFISFRFITANAKQFDTEVLKLNGTSNKFQRIRLSVDTNKEVTITCSNCDSCLTIEKEVNLKRFRELPSSNLDVSDWFCHRHDEEKIFDHTLQNKDESSPSCFNEKTLQFQPRTNDVFYAPFSLLMNYEVFDKNKLREKRKLIYCKRCLLLMGEHSNAITKFWWDCVKFSNKLFFDVASSIDLIKLVIKNHLACDGLSVLTPIVKIIFESTIPTDGKKSHILIQVMDRNLQLLKLSLKDMQLQERSTFKVMYLKLNEDNADDERTLKYWQKDINITTFELSFKMFHSLCEYLKTQSDLIPDVYRTNNYFQLSYIEFS